MRTVFRSATLWIMTAEPQQQARVLLRLWIVCWTAKSSWHSWVMPEDFTGRFLLCCGKGRGLHLKDWQPRSLWNGSVQCFSTFQLSRHRGHFHHLHRTCGCHSPWPTLVNVVRFGYGPAAVRTSSPNTMLVQGERYSKVAWEMNCSTLFCGGFLKEVHSFVGFWWCFFVIL